MVEVTYTDAQVAKFRRVARALVRFAEEADAIIYIDAGNINLMSGDSHDVTGGGERARQDRVVESVSMARSRIGAGDW